MSSRLDSRHRLIDIHTCCLGLWSLSRILVPIPRVDGLVLQLGECYSHKTSTSCTLSCGCSTAVQHNKVGSPDVKRLVMDHVTSLPMVQQLLGDIVAKTL